MSLDMVQWCPLFPFPLGVLFLVVTFCVALVVVNSLLVTLVVLLGLKLSGRLTLLFLIQTWITFRLAGLTRRPVVRLSLWPTFTGVLPRTSLGRLTFGNCVW